MTVQCLGHFCSEMFTHFPFTAFTVLKFHEIRRFRDK